MSFLIDTDICSAHLGGHRRLFSKFAQHAGQIHISAITSGELYSWALRSKAPRDRVQRLQDFLSLVTLLPIEHEEAYRFGLIRAGLLDRGRPRMSTDLFIAATALVHGLTLVTHNTRHFQNLPGLEVADWLTA
jgi:predicted nucleic acid-binding protein